jgi:hypothetical protein
MNVKISKRFVKDMQKITDQRILAKLRQTLVEAGTANSLSRTGFANPSATFPLSYA